MSELLELKSRLKIATLPDNPTKEDIQKEIERLGNYKTDAKNEDQAVKVILNSVYGVAGFPSFIGYNRDVAQSITKESEMLIKYTINCFNEFFRLHWHNQAEIHKVLGISDVKEVNYDVVNYADTDSIFLVLDRVYKDSGYTGTFIDFALNIKNNGLDAYIEKKLEDFVIQKHGIPRKPNGDPALVLELEQICDSVLWVAKKKYIKNYIYEGGVTFNPLDKIQVKGLELNQSATPKYVREKLMEFVKFILSSGQRIDIKKLTSMLASVKAEFSTLSIEHICRVERVGDYQKFIINDTTALEIGKDCKPHVRGAAYYNYLCRKHNLLSKYTLIKSSEKVSTYYTKNDDINDTFAFPVGSPFDPTLSPKIDKDIQFEKVFLAPINNILKVMNVPVLTSELMIYPSFTW